MSDMKTFLTGALVIFTCFGFGAPLVWAAPQINIDFQPLANEAVVDEPFQAGLHLEALGTLSRKAPLDIILVLDTSGSMNRKSGNGGGTRLEEAKKALTTFVGSLQENARAALVIFGKSSARTISTLGTYDKPTLINRIKDISATGNTPMGLGLQMATSLLNDSAPNAVRAIVFIADGHHNTGPGPERFYAGVPRDIVVFTIGAGNDVHKATDCSSFVPCKAGQQWLKEIAATGNGQGRYIAVPNESNLESVYQALEKEIVQLPIASQITATLKLRPEFKFISAIPAPQTIAPLTDGTKLTWSLANLKNGEFSDVIINLSPKTKLATQPQVLNYEFPASWVSYLASDGPATKPIGERVVTVRASNQPPVIRSLNVVPTSGQVNGTIFSATADAFDPDGDTLAYFWSGGDGIVTGNCGQFDSACKLKFPTTGNKNITLVVRDPSNASATQSASAKVTSATGGGSNVSCAATPALAYVGQEIKWLAVGAPDSASWTGTDELSGVGSKLFKVYSTPGQKSATVTSGGSSASCSVTIEPVYPKYREINPSSIKY